MWHGEQYRQPKTHEEWAEELLRNLRFEQLKDKPDVDRLTELRRDIASLPAVMVANAFNKIVDSSGW